MLLKRGDAVRLSAEELTASPYVYPVLDAAPVVLERSIVEGKRSIFTLE